MQQPTPTLNGVLKPADVIAKGPHVFDEPTRKYKEVQYSPTPYPRAMWHETQGYAEALNREQQAHMESEGWRSTPFPEKVVAKETVTAPAADLALIVLQQQQAMQQMQAQLAELQANKIASLVPEEPKRGPGRPPNPKPPEAA